MILFIILSIVVPVVALSADGRYHSRMTRDGTLYFINPKKLGKKENLKSFEYDMTCLTWSDSVTVNFTFVSSSMEVPSELSVVVGGKSFECKDFSPLYIDIHKKDYEVRITSKYPVWQITEMVKSPAAPIFKFVQGGVARSASYTDGAWKKDRQKLEDIFKLYEYTR